MCARIFLCIYTDRYVVLHYSIVSIQVLHSCIQTWYTEQRMVMDSYTRSPSYIAELLLFSLHSTECTRTLLALFPAVMRF